MVKDLSLVKESVAYTKVCAKVIIRKYALHIVISHHLHLQLLNAQCVKTGRFAQWNHYIEC